MHTTDDDRLQNGKNTFNKPSMPLTNFSLNRRSLFINDGSRVLENGSTYLNISSGGEAYEKLKNNITHKHYNTA